MSYKWIVLACSLPALTLIMIDVTIVNVALAKLSAVFSVDVATIQWTVTAFSLANGIFMPTASFIEGRFGFKRVWVAAIAGFTAGSALCGLAPSFWVLVVGRVIQGAAGGMLLPMTMSALFSAFPPNERGMAMGLLGISFVAGPSLGPVLGGYFVTYVDWRLVFFVNVPVGVASLLLAILLLRPGRIDTTKRFDVVGAILSTLGFGLFIYGLGRVGEDGWDSMTVRALLAFGGANLVALVVFELTRKEPLLDVRLYARPQFLIANILTWVGTVGQFGVMFMLPLYLQNLRGLTALDTGLLLMPQGLVLSLASPIAGRLVDRIGARSVAVAGYVLLAFSTWQLTNLTLNTTFDTVRWLAVVAAVGMGCALQPTALVALAAMPDHQRTNASSLLQSMKMVIASLGVTVISTTMQTQAVVHSAVLSWQVRPDTMSGALVGQLDGLLQSVYGLSAASAETVAVLLMMKSVTMQAAALAFDDGFRLAFVPALLAILVALGLPGRGAVKADRSAIASGD